MEILKKTINNLERIDHVSYISEFKATMSNKVYLNYMDSIYFDFASESKYDVPRYFLKKKEGGVLFNGENLYQSLHKENILIIGSKLSPNPPLLLTLFQLKKVLPKVLKDDQVEIIRQKDTTIQDVVSYKFEIVLPKKTINWDDFSIKKIKVNSNYTLLIDKLNFLPYKIIITNGPGGMFSRTFENLNYNFKPNDSIWKVSSLYPTYTRISFEDYYKAAKTTM